MSSPPTESVAVTGASGEIGGRVARLLAGSGAAPRCVVRDRRRAPELDGVDVAVADYGDGPAMRSALEGVVTLFLVSATESPDRVALHTSAVDAALAAGVEHIVYLSFLAAAPDATFTFGRDHWHTEAHVRASGLAFTFLRDSQYLDYLPLLVGPGGVIRGPAGDGALAPVARDDVARSAAAVLAAASTHAGRTYDLTGPRLVTMSDVARALSEAVGRRITYEAETLEEAYESRSG
ncbi:MAG: NmrA family NAD(P)-binding protein, partial [Acidimicrobiia bacterium]|nr:NmrA family NAD(P)-binding protein [Acidimicrobiia bacterium]